MSPADFPQANTTFGAPDGLAESQVQRLRAYDGIVDRGSLEGARVIVTAWKPTDEELEILNAGSPLLISFIGNLPPHMVTVRFEDAVRPA